MKALIIAPAWVGDMVMAHTLVQALNKQDADAEIHLVAPPTTAPLGTRMPGVHQVHELAVAHGALGWRERRRLGLSLRRVGFDAAYVLPNSFKSALLPCWAGIPRRIGALGEARLGLLNDWRRLDRDRHPKMIERFMALAYPPGQTLPQPYPAPALRVDAANREALVERFDLATSEPVTALCPGAEYGAAKRWPAEHFAGLAQARLKAGHGVWVIGSRGDQALGAAIAEAAPGTVNLAGRTRLADAVDLLSLADAVVTNDSGLMHVACALSVRVVALYGSTSPDFTPPLDANAQVLSLGLDCQPCFQRQCPLGHFKCLRELKPADVVQALRWEPSACPSARSAEAEGRAEP